jgi:hypothetical protein
MTGAISTEYRYGDMVGCLSGRLSAGQLDPLRNDDPLEPSNVGLPQGEDGVEAEGVRQPSWLSLYVDGDPNGPSCVMGYRARRAGRGQHVARFNISSRELGWHFLFKVHLAVDAEVRRLMLRQADRRQRPDQLYRREFQIVWQVVRDLQVDRDPAGVPFNLRARCEYVWLRRVCSAFRGGLRQFVACERYQQSKSRKYVGSNSRVIARQFHSNSRRLRQKHSTVARGGRHV